MPDPKALGEEGLTLQSPVTLVVNQVPMKTALKLLLRPLGLTYTVEDEVVLITSPEATQAADVSADLLRRRPGHVRVQGPEHVAGGHERPAGWSASEWSHPVFGNNSPFGIIRSTVQLPSGAVGPNNIERPKADMAPLIQLITNTIAPGTWKVLDSPGHENPAAYGMGGGFGGGADAGGDPQRQPGAIVPFFLSMSLIIKHTSEVHEQVGDLLRQLRRLQDLQVSVEVRFITVSDNFFEQIGVDFDFSIQSDAVGKHTTFAVPNPFGNIARLSQPAPALQPRPVAATGGGAADDRRRDGGGTTGGGGGGARLAAAAAVRLAAAAALPAVAAVRLVAVVVRGGATGRRYTTGASPAYIVNPILDHALRNNQPVIVGTQGAGSTTTPRTCRSHSTTPSRLWSRPRTWYQGRAPPSASRS